MLLQRVIDIALQATGAQGALRVTFCALGPGCIGPRRRPSAALSPLCPSSLCCCAALFCTEQFAILEDLALAFSCWRITTGVLGSSSELCRKSLDATRASSSSRPCSAWASGFIPMLVELNCAQARTGGGSPMRGATAAERWRELYGEVRGYGDEVGGRRCLFEGSLGSKNGRRRGTPYPALSLPAERAQ